jgi:HEAT repeat protein
VRPMLPVTNPEQLTRWIADLDNESFTVRQKAQRSIQSLGEPAIPALQRALADGPPLEVKRRLLDIITTLEPKLGAAPPIQLRQIRAIQVLESLATPEARQVLQNLAKGADASLTREAQAALKRLARRSASKP